VAVCAGSRGSPLCPRDPVVKRACSARIMRRLTSAAGGMVCYGHRTTISENAVAVRSTWQYERCVATQNAASGMVLSGRRMKVIETAVAVGRGCWCEKSVAVLCATDMLASAGLRFNDVLV
jgi:hypothetical protein